LSGGPALRLAPRRPPGALPAGSAERHAIGSGAAPAALPLHLAARSGRIAVALLAAAGPARACLALLVALGAGPLLPTGTGRPAAAPIRFEIVSGAPENLVRFESRAPVESFSGKTRAIRGWIEVDPLAIGDSVGVFVEVDLADLDTGIALRDKHMRENHLETDRYPTAVFRGARVQGDPAVEAGASRRLTAEPQGIEIEGELELHGVRRPLRLTVTLALRTGGEARRIEVSCRFPVSLAEHAIARPRFLVMKLADRQEIAVTATATEVP